MWGEWAARPTAIRRACSPSEARSARSSAAASRSPETITDRGPLCAATTRRPSQRRSRGSTSSAGASTETMSPCPARVAWAWLHRATTRAESSRDSAPQTAAAVTSPTLCPSTAAGSTPWEHHSAASDTVTANSRGWTTSARSPAGAPGASGSRSTSIGDQSTNGSRACAHASIRSRNTGEVSSRSTAIRGHCAPCPGNTKATRRPAPAVPSTRPGMLLPSASASSRRRNPSRPSATSAALRLPSEAVRARVSAMSWGLQSSRPAR